MRSARSRILRLQISLWWPLLGVLASIAASPLAHASAQEPTLRFERLTIEQGLSQNNVYSLLQDRAGFMWLGTGDGLDRYDGYSFTVYNADPANPHSLSNNAVLALLEDRAGDLWVATRRGLNRFDRATNSFTHFLPDQRLSALVEDAAGNLWVGTWGGTLQRFDRASQSFTAFNVCGVGSGCLLRQDCAGTYWLTDKTGLRRFDPASGALTPVVVDAAFPDMLT
jgi:ligand-binding sensor domain-containing protein